MAYTEEQKREHIHELQTYLHGLSHVDESIPHIGADGFYGPITAEAVRAFQQQNQLRPTGETNTATWTAITNAYRNQVRIPTIMMSIFPDGITTYVAGDSGPAIFVIQSLLQAIQSRFKEMPGVNINGIYDAPTQSAIQRFQIYANLPVTGETDPTTWNHLVAALANDFSYIWR